MFTSSPFERLLCYKPAETNETSPIVVSSTFTKTIPNNNSLINKHHKTVIYIYIQIYKLLFPTIATAKVVMRATACWRSLMTSLT